MSKGRKPIETVAKTADIHIRVTPDRHNQWLELARRAGKSLTDFLAFCVDSQPKTAVESADGAERDGKEAI